MRLDQLRSWLDGLCVHEHLEYRSSRLSVSPWDYGVIVTLGADEREAAGGDIRRQPLGHVHHGREPAAAQLTGP
jgi:hypothetical protein